MKNFEYWNPTRIVFGKDTIKSLQDLIPVEAKILITYGGGSIKKNGVYDQVKETLTGRSWLEFGGIEPNPTYETLMEAVKLVRKELVTFILAVGGGSVLDGTKFISAAANYMGDDPWDIWKNGAKFENPVPFGSVLTLPATGSEMNSGAVITRKSSLEKLASGHPTLFPQFSILDPETTYSLPQKQLRNGMVDTFMHVMEQYLTYPVNTPLQDRQAEAILKTLVEDHEKMKQSDPADYDARASFMWCATQALNGTLRCGVVTDWATHVIAHELTAFYGLAHAETLAIIYPALIQYKGEQKTEKMRQYVDRIFDLRGLSDEETQLAAVEKTKQFLHTLGMPTQLNDYGINPDEAAQKISQRFAERGWKLGEHQDILAEDVRRIVLAAA
jgi:NADP-dependent alcohol dehydrogenase